MTSDDLEAYNLGLLEYLTFTAPFNTASCPAASVPLHWMADGLPVGVQFGARFGGIATLIRLTGQLEKARPWADRRPQPAS